MDYPRYVGEASSYEPAWGLHTRLSQPGGTSLAPRRVPALQVAMHRMSVSSAASSWVCRWLCTMLAYPCHRTRRGHVRGVGVLCYGGMKTRDALVPRGPARWRCRRCARVCAMYVCVPLGSGRLTGSHDRVRMEGWQLWVPLLVIPLPTAVAGASRRG